MVFVFTRNDIERSHMAVLFLLGLTALALYLCYILVAPFLKPILFAVIFAVVFYPAHAQIRRWIHNPNSAAALSTTTVILVIGAVSFSVGRALVSGLQDIYESLSGPVRAESVSSPSSFRFSSEASRGPATIFRFQFRTCSVPF